MWRNTFLSAMVIVFIGSLLGGCCWIGKKFVQSGQNQLVANSADAQFDFARSQEEAFKRCMRTWGAQLAGQTRDPRDFVNPVKIFRELFPDSEYQTKENSEDNLRSALSELMKKPAVKLALKITKSETLAKFYDIYHFIAGKPGNKLFVVKSDGDAPVFKFTRKEFRNFSKELEDVLRFDGFQETFKELNKIREELRGKNKKSDRDLLLLTKLEMSTRMTEYCAAYMTAYFRDGDFASVVINTADLKNAIKKRLKTSFPWLDPDASGFTEIIEQLVKRLPRQDDNILLIGKISETSFKTRNGVDYKFPAITATLSPGSKEFITVSKVDFVGVGADLIRVFLEAVGDAEAGVPGITEATGCKIAEEDMRLPVFVAKNETTKITLEEFGNVNTYANKVEGAVSSAIGRVIRGAGWFSLNNESVAVLIETAIGVIAKKVSEKVIWCGYYAAHNDNGNKKEYEIGPTGAKTLVPYGIGRKPHESMVSAQFEVVGGERLDK